MTAKEWLYRLAVKTVEEARAALTAAAEAAPTEQASAPVEPSENERIMAGDLKRLLDAARAYRHCPSTHCARSAECRSPSECCAIGAVIREMGQPLPDDAKVEDKP